jgi:hypothetical protein
MVTHKTNIFPHHKKEPLEDADHEFESAEGQDFAKSKVECICLGCGKMHIMKMHWIGRGVPRKFCEHCRDRKTPADDNDSMS